MFSGWSRISTSFDFNPDEKETKLFKLHDKGGIADGKYLDVMQVNEVILSYPWLFKPRAPQQRQDGSMSESRYTAQFIMPIETHRDAIVQIKSQISRFAKVCVGQEMPLDRTCLRDGRQQMDRPEVQQAFYVNTATGIAPDVRLRDASKAQASDAAKFYAGCIVNAYFGLWYQNNPPAIGGKRINGNLIAVQWVADGKPLGARIDTTGLFDDLGAGEVAEIGAEDDSIDF